MGKRQESIVGLAIFAHVDEQELDRISFHNTWDNVARVSGHIQKILRSNFSGLSATAIHLKRLLKNQCTDEPKITI